VDVLMPQLGETVAEGKITQWFKSAGDAVKPGDNLFEIETDKVSMEVPSTTAGVLAEIRVPVGEVAPVGAVVAVIADGAAASAPAAPGPLSKPAVAPAGAPANRLQPRATPAAAGEPAAAAIKLDPFFEVRTPQRNYGPARLPGGGSVTPLARRLAAEGGIDLGTISPSGPHGRIVARDVEAAARAARQATPRPPPAPPPPTARLRARPRARLGPERRRRQGALPRRAVPRGAARRHAHDHRHPSGAGEADHPAFLPDRGRRDRAAHLAARRRECGRAQGQRR